MYYVLEGDRQEGPFSEEQIREKIATGEWTGEKLGWRDGLPSWMPLSEILGDAGPSDQSNVLPPASPAIPPRKPNVALAPPSMLVSASGAKGEWKWYDYSIVIFPVLVCCFPIGIIPLWLTKRFEKSTKVALTALIGVGFLMYQGVSLRAHQRRVHDSPQEAADLGRETVEASNPAITWREVNSIYNVRSRYSEFQKNEEWKRFKGERVTWRGVVSEVSSGVFGLKLQVRMNANTFTSDLIVSLRESSKGDALRLHKGEWVTFSGTLESWGSILPISLSDGDIVGN